MTYGRDKSLAIIASLLMVALLTGCPATAQLNSAEEEEETARTVSVRGEGVVTLNPDIAFIDAGVVTRGKTANLALRQNADLMSEVFDVLKGLGVERRDMRTSNLSLSPQYDRRSSSEDPLLILGYTATNRLQLKIRDLDSLGDILDAVVTAGVNQVSGPTFMIDDPSKARDEARVLAVKNATSHATTLANAAGVKLGQIISLTESGPYRPAPQQRALMVMEASAAPTPVAAGELEIRVSVNAVFGIE